MRLKLLSCEVFARELAACLPGSAHELRVQFFSKGWHELEPALMRRHLQQVVDATSIEHFDAIVLAYGLCRYATAGLKARALPLVVPRAHDCITLLLGSRERYTDYFFAHPGVYFRSCGWLERRKNPAWLREKSIAEKNGLNASADELTVKYGEEAGQFLSQCLGCQTRHYNRLAFIETGVEPDDRFEKESRAEAAAHGWEFEKLEGDLRLLRDLIGGDWNDGDFLIVPPGHELRATYDGNVMASFLPGKEGQQP